LSQPPDTWASEMQALQDQIEVLQLDLDCARRNEAAATYWYGQDDGVRGACKRWDEALTDPIPKDGTMREPLESLYRRTEVLRLDLAAAIGDIALVRGQRDGLATLLATTLQTINAHWLPHNKAAETLRAELMKRLLKAVDAVGEARVTGAKP